MDNHDLAKESRLFLEELTTEFETLICQICCQIQRIAEYKTIPQQVLNFAQKRIKIAKGHNVFSNQEITDTLDELSVELNKNRLQQGKERLQTLAKQLMMLGSPSKVMNN